MEIAVFQDNSGKTQSFLEPGIIKVYTRIIGKWEITKEIVFRIDNITSINEVRDHIRNMAEALETCKVFVGREVKGVPYNVLDGIGFNIWELEGAPEEFLDFVNGKEEEEAEVIALEKGKNQLSIIEKIKDGNYFLDLKKIQEKNINLTSKGILLPFLNNTTFYELQIVCGHLPPWFESEFKRLNLKAEIEVIRQNEIRVTVYPKVCR